MQQLRSDDRGDRENYHYGQRHPPGICSPFDRRALGFNPTEHCPADQRVYQ
jgi:hypothetical protein